jgi:hypothetical protein
MDSRRSLFCLTLSTTFVLVAGCRPQRDCPPGQDLCGGSCTDVSIDARHCGACSHACGTGEACQGGTCHTCQQGDCTPPDLYAVCFSGSLVGYHSKTGAGLPPFTVSVPAADGGAPIVPGGLGLLFSDAKTLWLLDTSNSQVDVLDVTRWPPSVLGSVRVGQAPNQLALCDGMVLFVNSVDGTLQGIDPVTHATVNEVSLGAGTNPYLSACDGAHGVYVTDYMSGDVKAVDLSTWTVTATLTIPPQDVAVGAKPYPQGVAFVHPVGWDAGAVFVSLGNAAIDGGIFSPQGPALVLEFDAALQAVQAVIDPGSACTNGSYLWPSTDGSELFESCGGVYGADTSGFVAPIGTASRQAGPLIPVPTPNPSTLVGLKDGLLAVDGSGNQIVVFNPYDAGVLQTLAPCPTLPDGGTVSPYDFVGGLVAAP